MKCMICDKQNEKHLYKVIQKEEIIMVIIWYGHFPVILEKCTYTYIHKIYTNYKNILVYMLYKFIFMLIILMLYKFIFILIMFILYKLYSKLYNYYNYICRYI